MEIKQEYFETNLQTVKTEPLSLSELEIQKIEDENYDYQKQLSECMIKNEILTMEIKQECSLTNLIEVKSEPSTFFNTETAASINNTSLKKEKIAKTYAQRQKEYRERKKIEKQLHCAKKIPKTNAERQQQFRQNQKEKANETFILARKKKNAERVKRYRDKLKLKKQRAELDSVLSPKEDSLSMVSIENKKETNKNLIFGEVQIQQSINTEAQQVISPSFLSFEAPYEEHDECSTPNVLLHHEIGITGDGNCLFSSLIRILHLQISASVLRQQLYNSPYLNTYQNPINARSKLSSEFQYGDLDDLFIFSRTYNQNVCVHFHYFNITTKTEVVRFCYFKVNDSINFLHLHLRNTRFTPYIVVQENEDFTSDKSSDMEIENRSNITYYTDYYKHSSAHLEFYRQFQNNTFGHTCAVCDRLCWKNDLKKASNIDKNILQTIIPNYECSSNIDICSTCKASLDKNKIPILSTYNGFKYPTIPSYLPTLNIIEQRLISPRIPFMQIRRLNQIINIPVEVDTMVKKLPRNIEDDQKIIYNTSNVHDLINKNNIKEWLKYLVETPLYIHYKIEIDDAFLNCDINIEDKQTTLLWNENMVLHIAKDEQSSLIDEYAEEFSFPIIYGGQFRNYREEITVTPLMQVNSELRRTDRRGADPQHLLYQAAKIMRVRVSQSVTVASKDFGELTKEQIQSERYINHCLDTNLAFLQYIPNSAWYWADCKKNLFAMIRQLGAPTAFMMLSADETGWINLVKLLYKLKNNETDIPDELMNYVQKAKLVNEDSVTCAIYFNKLVNCLLKILQYQKKSPFGKYRVNHYFKRIEFQNHGSPHVHILLWLDNVPKNLLSNDKNVIQMIDELVSVSEADASGNIKLQTHKQIFMPSRYTITLLPDSNFSEQILKEYKNHYKLIRTNLENFEYTDFHDFYTHNNIDSDEHYYNIIRAGIDRPKLFYRRKPSEKWHNSFNPFVLHHLKSNMDFQIIQDEYTCAAYVIEYVNKYNKGISNLQQQIIHIMDENPEFDIDDITKKISIDMLHSVEMSVQEAVLFLLREPISKTSTATVYIPTMYPSERQKIRKSLKELNELDNENWFDKYEKRPEELNNVTLAQFVAKYFINKKGVYTERDTPKIIRYCNYNMVDNFNDYKREMVLLHIPFRSEDNEILADNKFIEIYENNKDLILERRKEFELNLDLQKTLEICRQQLCRNDNEDDQLSHSIVNVDIQKATVSKLDAIAKKKEEEFNSETNLIQVKSEPFSLSDVEIEKSLTLLEDNCQIQELKFNECNIDTDLSLVKAEIGIKQECSTNLIEPLLISEIDIQKIKETYHLIVQEDKKGM